MTNSPVIFQAIINEILRDLVNESKIAIFVDDILIGTEIKKEHNKIVEKVLRRLEKNNLYVKPEKCM